MLGISVSVSDVPLFCGGKRPHSSMFQRLTRERLCLSRDMLCLSCERLCLSCERLCLSCERLCLSCDMVCLSCDMVCLSCDMVCLSCDMVCSSPGFGEGKYVAFQERQWHQPCFKCSRCSVSLVGAGFFPDRDLILCKDCNDE